MSRRPLNVDRLANPSYLRRRLAGLRRARAQTLQRLRDIEAAIVEIEEELWRLSGRDRLRGRGDRLGGEDDGSNAH